jgi:hypothetical protein
MKLIDRVNERRKEIRTDGYSMSIGEWISLYENDEMDIHPEFQRIFRWSEVQKTNLIESILLGIPIPPIFVSQRSDGIWDVVDGLQRLSTILELVGVLKDQDKKIIPPLTLTKTKYLPELENKHWDDLDSDLRLIIKRSKIGVSIILKESDDTAKYDLFQRLNTGGSQLSPQEVRNCIMVMLNKDFYDWLTVLASYAPFQECVALSERPVSQAYDIELALRFIIFSLIDESELVNIGDVGVFITDKMSEVCSSESFDHGVWDALFKKTFDLLSSTLNSNAFKRYNTEKNKFMGGFLLSQFEVVAYGIAFNLNAGVAVGDVDRKVAAIWSDEAYTAWSGSGITATRRLPRILPYGRKIFANANPN